MPVGMCGRCGNEEPDDRWVELDVTMSAGQRGPQHWSTVPTRIAVYPLCGACIASPWGEAVRAFLADQWQLPVPPRRPRAKECSVICVNPWPRWRQRLNAWRGSPYTRCPHCESLAVLAIIDRDDDDDEPQGGRLGRLWARWLDTIWPPKTLQEKQ